MIMTVLSLFDGMSCGQLALQRAGIKVGNYFASEVDKYAIKVTQHNFPNTIQIGDVSKVRFSNGVLYTEKGAYNIGKIQVLLAGSPCQGFSFAGKQLNFDDPRSKLFFEYVRLKNEINPDYFLLENVKMKKEYQDVITEHLNVNPVEINSSLVSAQNRVRLYWSNLNIQQPEDKGILLKDVIEKDVEGKYYHTDSAINYMNREVKGGRNHWDFGHHSDTDKEKSSCITANFRKGVPYNVLVDKEIVRKLAPLECEKLQTVPPGYTSCVSDSQRYKMLGNGWTVDVVAHILSGIKSPQPHKQINYSQPQLRLPL